MDKLLVDNIIRELYLDYGYNRVELRKLPQETLENLYEEKYSHIDLLSLKEKLRSFKVSVCSEVYYGSRR